MLAQGVKAPPVLLADGVKPPMIMTVDGMQPPLLYPCASRVKMPHVGADETTFHAKKTFQSVKQSASKTKPRSPPPASVSKSYLRKVSTGLAFSEDVIKERSYSSLPYDNKYFSEAIDISGLIPTPPKSKYPTGRHNARGSDSKHLPCHILKRSSHKLKPMKRRILEKALHMHQEAIDKEACKLQKEQEEEQSKEQLFLTEVEIQSDKPTPPKHDWDEYIVSILSETTARWIVTNQVDAGEQQDKLITTLNTYYGPTDEKAELVREDMSEGDMTERSKKHEVTKSHKWKRADES